MFNVNCSKPRIPRKRRKLEAQCLVCEKIFQHKSHLTSHMRTHSTDTPHRCSYCDESFRKKAELTKHVKFHDTRKYPYMCARCGKVFRKLDQLGLHVESHQDEEYLEFRNNGTTETPLECSEDLPTSPPAIWNKAKFPGCHSEPAPLVIGIKTETDT